MTERTIKIAVVQSLDGKVTVCGPDEGHDHASLMEAAMCWSLEAGEIPANRYWVTVTLPAPSSTEIDLGAALEEFE